MTTLLKVSLVGTVGLGGAGLVGSNALIRKKVLVKPEDKEWDDKLAKLLQKVKSDSENVIVKKIDNPSEEKLKLSFDKNNFESKENALGALKDWCDKAITREDKGLEKELCKVEKTVGWMYA